jgi:hypothetical protein
MACGAIPEPFPVLTAEAMVARGPREAPAGIGDLSEKDNTRFQPAWQEIVDFS